MKLSEHFDTEESRCRCGCGFGENPDDVPISTVALLELARMILGKPLPVSSWCRCEAHNEAEGGTPNSAHTRGTAADLSMPFGSGRYYVLVALILAAEVLAGLNLEKAKALFTELPKYIAGIGVYPWGIHVDTDKELPRPSSWPPSPKGKGATR